MRKLQEIKSNKQSKYDEIIEYLSQDNGYWLENDRWDLEKQFFVGKKSQAVKYIDFSSIKSKMLMNEVKYYFVYSFKNKHMSHHHMRNLSPVIKIFSDFYTQKSLASVDKEKLKRKWILFLNEKNLNTNKFGNKYVGFIEYLTNFIEDFYDEREEIEKDIWYSKNIKGVKIPASGVTNTLNGKLDFSYKIPIYYREIVKRYFKTIITKKSWNHCFQILNHLNYFFDKFYSNGYTDGFIENLSRQDIENYLYWINNDYKDKNATYKSKFISYIRTFLEYIQIAQYDKAPKKEISFLVFQDDIPKRESNKDEVKKAKFVPEPILKQLDNNIMDLDRPQFIPIYILLRETGWRGTDILNLRYDNCLEQIWNNKEEKYNYYLCGEITKTGIAQLKIPIRDKVAEMVQKSIDKAKELSTDKNNPMKYLFNTYEGKLKGKPLAKATLLITIKRLIVQKDIRDVNGELYHFRLHSLRHTRAKEYVEQGMGISIIQQILGHQSLQMTVHYATVTENVLYEK
ncbi:hypothetical protein CBOS2020_26720 [Clostridium botulinum]|nr:hypothetical protein CBOS2020_26720 [Clostridium botulinum]